MEPTQHSENGAIPETPISKNVAQSVVLECFTFTETQIRRFVPPGEGRNMCLAGLDLARYEAKKAFKK